MKRANRFQLIATAICALSATICIAQSGAKVANDSFTDFPAKVSAVSTPPLILKFKSAQARRYRTVIREASKEKPNFAGHYRIATWGCGTDCHGFAIIDFLSGSVFTAQGIETISGVMGNDDPRLDFRPDSSLLIISGQINEDPQTEARHLFHWDGKKLSLIAVQPLPKMQF